MDKLSGCRHRSETTGLMPKTKWTHHRKTGQMPSDDRRCPRAKDRVTGLVMVGLAVPGAAGLGAAASATDGGSA